MDTPAPLSTAARTLGFAGLLPQGFAVLLVMLGHVELGSAIAVRYAAVIVSFLGGIWWGCAMRRRARQGGLAALSVLPSLAAFGLLFVPGVGAFAGLATVAMLTLLVDRALERGGEAPAGWFRFRFALSSLLALLTLAAGLLAFAR